MVEQIQRKLFASSFRTAFTRALQVIDGVLPVQLAVDERRRTHGLQGSREKITAAKKEAKNITLERLQEE